MKNEGRKYLRTDEGAVRVEEISYLDAAALEKEGYVVAHYKDMKLRITGFFAIEAVMVLKPSVLEGRRLSWHKNAWFFHNVFVHPAMQFMAAAGGLLKPVWPRASRALYRRAIGLHDDTVPVPKGFRKPAVEP